MTSADPTARAPLTARLRTAVTSVVPARALVPAAQVTAMLLPVIAVAAYASSWAGGEGTPGEMHVFGPAGSAMLTGRWSQVFADPAVQAGPLELLPFGAAALLGLDGTVWWTVFHTVSTAALLLLFLVAARPVTDRVPARRALWLTGTVGVLVCMIGFVPWAINAGHPAQVAVPALWVLAARAARDGRFATVGVVIGLSTGFEVWGVLGAPVIFLAARPRLLRAAWAGLATVLVIYGPFVATGVFHMFEFRWRVAQGSLVHTLWPALETFPWTLRLLQASCAVVLGVAVAVAVRRTVHGVWLVPLVVIAARLTLDPLTLHYYWIGPGVVAVAAVGVALAARSSGMLATTVLGLAWVATPQLRGMAYGALWMLGCVLCVAVTLAVVSRRRRARDDAATPDDAGTPRTSPEGVLHPVA